MTIEFVTIEEAGKWSEGTWVLVLTTAHGEPVYELDRWEPSIGAVKWGRSRFAALPSPDTQGDRP